MIVAFFNFFFKIKIMDHKTGKTLATGSRQCDLYALDFPKSASFARYSKKASEGIWHARLAHPQSKCYVFLITKIWLMLTPS